MAFYIDSLETIKKKLGIEENGPAQAFMTETCYKAMDQYVPKDIGNLRENVDLKVNSITYESPYAQYQYYGKKMVMSNGKSAFYDPEYGFWSKRGEKKTLTDEDLVYHYPGTGPYWDQRMISANMNDVVKQVQDYIKRR